jgi:hypothetical protein
LVGTGVLPLNMLAQVFLPRAGGTVLFVPGMALADGAATGADFVAGTSQASVEGVVSHVVLLSAPQADSVGVDVWRSSLA